MSLTADRLRQLLTYDPDTGIFRWKVRRGNVHAGNIAGSTSRQGYIQIQIEGRTYAAARLAFLYMQGELPPHQMDHRDLDKSNNKWLNLRPATNTQNSRNVRGFGRDGIKNIYRQDGGWLVRVGKGSCKSFKSLEDALIHRNRLLREVHGSFARFEDRREQRQ